MPAREHIDNYLEGWRLGDGNKSLCETVEGFFYEDPNTGRIERQNFVQFVERFKDAVVELNNCVLPDPFLTDTDVVLDESTEPATAWCWWQATETTLQGAAPIKFSDKGVLSERIAYFSALPK